MPKARKIDEDQLDLLALLKEQAEGPLACPHVFRVGPNRDGYGWVHDLDPTSDYYLEWVHSDPRCRRSALPGKHKQPTPEHPLP